MKPHKMLWNNTLINENANALPYPSLANCFRFLKPIFFPGLKAACLLCLMLMGSRQLEAKVTLPGIFSSNMVLQQKDNVKLWGGSTGKLVSITTSWNNKKYQVTVDRDYNWSATVATPAAGGPFVITMDDGEKLMLTNVLIGEVWVCSGQSNMEMPVKGKKNQPTLNSTEILLGADNPEIRLMRYEKTLNRVPQRDSKSTLWQLANAENARDFSAVGFQFAQMLQQKLKVPIGIIHTAWGATEIESWMTAKSLKNYPEIKIKALSDTAALNHHDPSILFNTMVNPFLGYAIKGVIWYQGEANRTNPEIYDQLMVSMVEGWREAWQRDFAFYYVQIAPCESGGKPLAGALVREAQLKASSKIPNSGMAVTMDIGEEKLIHPANKTAVSKRLALQALAKTYGIKGLPYQSPVYKAMNINKDVVTLSFANAENGLSSFGKELALFEVAGADKVFYPAKARISANGVAVQSDKVKMPVAVRYAFKNWAQGDLFNVEGFPASSFRTDDW